VIDPAAGSYYIEHLTTVLAEKAWERFRELDAERAFS
jgi:methylmalonyl-CoA mutase